MNSDLHKEISELLDEQFLPLFMQTIILARILRKEASEKWLVEVKNFLETVHSIKK